MATLGVLILVVLLSHHFYLFMRVQKLKEKMVERELYLLNLLQNFDKDHLNAQELQAVAHPIPVTLLLSNEELKPFITRTNNVWTSSEPFQAMCRLIEIRKKKKWGFIIGTLFSDTASKDFSE